MLGEILARRTLRLGAWLDAPPLGMRSATGAADGLDIALARHFAEGIGVALRVVSLPPEGRVAALLEGRVDLLGTLAVTPESLRAVSFARPHGELCVVLATPRGAGIRSFAELAGRRLGVEMNSFLGESLARQAPPGTVVVPAEDSADALLLLENGQVDAAATLDWIVAGRLAAEPGADLEVGFTMGSWQHGFAVRPGEHDLLRLVNTFVGLARSDGRLAELQAAYLGSFGGSCLR